MLRTQHSLQNSLRLLNLYKYESICLAGDTAISVANALGHLSVVKAIR
jgi:hypothetical protein